MPSEKKGLRQEVPFEVETLFIMVKGPIQWEYVIILNLYAQNNVVSKNIKQKVSENSMEIIWN